MFDTLRRAFKIKDLRRRIGYTFLMLIVIRLGSELPTPGVNPSYIKEFFAQNTGEAFNLFNAFTGGSFEQMSVFALSITPYITSSIIIQLLTIAIPQLEEMQKDGEDGRKKLTKITRYLNSCTCSDRINCDVSWIWTSGTSERIQLCKCCNRSINTDSRIRILDVGR